MKFKTFRPYIFFSTLRYCQFVDVPKKDKKCMKIKLSIKTVCLHVRTLLKFMIIISACCFPLIRKGLKVIIKVWGGGY